MNKAQTEKQIIKAPIHSDDLNVLKKVLEDLDLENDNKDLGKEVFINNLKIIEDFKNE